MDELKKEMSSYTRPYLPLLLLPLLCLLVYLPALHHDFVIDDAYLVIQNPYIKSWNYLPQMLSKDASNISDPSNYWRPVFSISLALDYSVWGLNPIGFHLTNILLHAINTVLLYLLCKRLRNTTCAVFASLLFALHPIQAHTVNVISTRGDLLAAFFTFLSLHAFFSKKTIPFAIALVFSLLSKETSMVLPLALLLAWMIVERDKQEMRLLLAFAILSLYLVVRLSLGFSFSLIPLVFSYHAPLNIRWLLAFKALALYFLALLNLFELPHPFWSVEIPTSLNDSYVIGGIVMFGLLLGAIWKSLGQQPLVAFGLGWFLIYFLPISNLKQLNQPMAEHWLYIPMIGLCLAFGGFLNAAWTQLPKLHLARVGLKAGVAVFLVFAVLVVWEKSKIYQDDESFLLAAIRANPQVARLYSMLGSIYLAKQDASRAKEFYTKALHLDPDEFFANYRIGFLFYQAGQKDEAKTYLEKVVRLDPVPLYEVPTVAHAWEMLGDRHKAFFYYRKALELNPESDRIKQKVASLENQLRPQISPSVPHR